MTVTIVAADESVRATRNAATTFAPVDVPAKIARRVLGFELEQQPRAVLRGHAKQRKQRRPSNAVENRFGPGVHGGVFRARRSRILVKERPHVKNFLQITPFMTVRDIETALRFFTETLGFHIVVRFDRYAYVERESVAIRIMEENGEYAAPPGNRRFAYYIDVRDVDALYAELKPRLDALPAEDVYGPIDQSYGQRELLVLAPDGNLIAFGQGISA